MIFNDVIMDIYTLSYNSYRIELRNCNSESLALIIDGVSMGTITYYNGSVFYKDWITDRGKEEERRDYFLDKLKYERVLKIKERYYAELVTIYKIMGVKDEYI